MRAVAAGATPLLVAALACGTENVELAARGGDGGGGGQCTADGPECNNCIDDDDDGLIDGFDPHCISALDDREDSFATGLPGDNMDEGTQDCFFDGNSGHGDDGCRIPSCCLIDPEAEDCPPPDAQDFLTCEPPEVCVENCAPLAPPGCDCFGCCTVCVDETCRDVITHPALAPDCDLERLDDPEACPVCQKSPTCGPACDPEQCILCPGQSQEDLPPHCEEPSCPDGLFMCASSGDCAGDEFCSNGCCIGVVE